MSHKPYRIGRLNIVYGQKNVPKTMFALTMAASLTDPTNDRDRIVYITNTATTVTTLDRSKSRMTSLDYRYDENMTLSQLERYVGEVARTADRFRSTVLVIDNWSDLVVEIPEHVTTVQVEKATRRHAFLLRLSPLLRSANLWCIMVVNSTQTGERSENFWGQTAFRVTEHNGIIVEKSTTEISSETRELPMDSLQFFIPHSPNSAILTM